MENASLENRDETVPDRAGNKLDALNEAGKRIQELVEQIDALPDSPARVLFQECLESVLKFYGYGLERILQIVATGPEGKKVYGDLIRDGAEVLSLGLEPLLGVAFLHLREEHTRIRRTRRLGESRQRVLTFGMRENIVHQNDALRTVSLRVRRASFW